MYDHGQPPPPTAPPPSAPPARADFAGRPWIIAAIVGTIVFDLFVAGSIVDRVRYWGWTSAEIDAATGNGVVPGAWLLMPLMTVVAVVPVSAAIGLIARVVGEANRPGRFLVPFAVGLVVLSGAAMWVLVSAS